MTTTLHTLLRNVANHDVWLENDGRSVLTNREHFGVSDPVCEVTAEVGDARSRGLVVADGILWTLTDRGRDWLRMARAGS